MVVVLLLSRLCVRTKLCLAHNKRGVLSNGEFNSSTKHNMPMSAAYGLLDSSILPSSQASQASQASQLAGASSQPAVISLL